MAKDGVQLKSGTLPFCYLNVTGQSMSFKRQMAHVSPIAKVQSKLPLIEYDYPNHSHYNSHSTNCK